MTLFLTYYLPVFLLAYLLVSFVVPSVRVYRQTGINPVTFGRTDSAHDYIGFIMKLLTALLCIAVLIFSLSKQAYSYLVPIPYLEHRGIQIAGLVLAHFSLGWIVLAQLQMRNSWRIGIDEKNKTELVTQGLFGVSRNPIFFGMILSVLGLFLILPNMISFFAAAGSYLIIQIQIRLEEAFLQREHGEQYNAYKSAVRRLI